MGEIIKRPHTEGVGVRPTSERPMPTAYHEYRNSMSGEKPTSERPSQPSAMQVKPQQPVPTKQTS